MDKYELKAIIICDQSDGLMKQKAKEELDRIGECTNSK